ncbi:hypothetical protein [Amycolatopsis vancoresmycina]|uniref:Htaa domain-containing protein n=1 Tax=Amycolatopsis vancoresmycina DSM 44592 TaxID=1292037 RepID=R1IAX4_9PSEU|nr:hypothetical protein [Amycolatopsis vancoresmycina]EOD69681.1 hypothetical protein H480_04972 [Amycolatopsis vancoresmycina DSM 44592]
MTTRSRLRALAIGLATTLPLVGGTTAAVADPATTVSVSGSGHGLLPGDRFPMWAGEPVTFGLDAHATPQPGNPWHATGQWQAVHTEPDGSLYAAFGGTIDTLTAAGSLAVLNGVVTWKNNPGNPDLPMIGTPVALSVADRPDGDRVGFAWGFAGEPVAPGQAHVPFLALDQSTLTVHTPVPGPRGGVPGSRNGLPERHIKGTLDQGGRKIKVNADAPAGAPPSAATGTITISDGAATTFDATVTELDASGPVAIATATVTAGSDRSLIGRRISVSVYDGGRFDWADVVPPGQEVLPYQGVVPWRPAIRSDLTVLD